MIAIDGRYIQDHFPGIGRYTYNLVDALARVAPDEAFVVLHNPAQRNTRYDVAALAQYRNVQLCRVDIPALSLREQFLISHLQSLGNASQSPISNLQSPVSNLQLFHSPYYIKPYFTRVPSIVTIFDLIPLLFPQTVSRRARWLFRRMVTLAARTAARVITSSQATCDDLVMRLGISRSKIAVIPLAADARFAPQSESEVARVRAKYGLSMPYILSVGINKPHKNFRTLIEAWARVETDSALVIAGAWDDRYAATSGLTSTSQLPWRAVTSSAEQVSPVKFIHNIDDADLPALYTGAELFILPSLYEGFGLPVLEAMACGVPVLASNISSLPEVGGDAALYFDPRDANALAALITRVLNDRALQGKLRDASVIRAREFSWEKTAEQTMAVYRAGAQ